MLNIISQNCTGGANKPALEGMAWCHGHQCLVWVLAPLLPIQLLANVTLGSSRWNLKRFSPYHPCGRPRIPDCWFCSDFMQPWPLLAFSERTRWWKLSLTHSHLCVSVCTCIFMYVYVANCRFAFQIKSLKKTKVSGMPISYTGVRGFKLANSTVLMHILEGNRWWMAQLLKTCHPHGRLGLCSHLPI